MSNLKYIGAVKAGKLANGYERDKGKVVHIIEGGDALCRTKRPANQWSERELTEASCPKCIKQLRVELAISNLLNQVDEMVKV